MLEEDLDGLQGRIREELSWQGPIFVISAATKEGAQNLAYEVMNHIEEQRDRCEHDPEFAEQYAEFRSRLEEEARVKMRELQQAKRKRKRSTDDDDDHDMEIIYAE